MTDETLSHLAAIELGLAKTSAPDDAVERVTVGALRAVVDLARTAATLQERVRELETENEKLEAHININCQNACAQRDETLAQSRAREAKLVEALREVKILCCTVGAPGEKTVLDGIGRMLRLCIDAGITAPYSELRAALEGDKPHG